MRKLSAVAAVAIVLVVGACGGSSKKATNADATGTTAATAVSVGSNAGVAFGSFCGARAAFAYNPAVPSAGDIKSTIDANKASMDKARNEVPAEIRADFNTLADGFDVFYNAMKASNYNVITMAQNNADALRKLQDPDYRAAAQRINDWVAAHCK
jgi:hypothetical protein